MNAIEFKNVTKHYDDFTLDHLNLSVPSGCIVGFIGENGAGKTTSMKMIFDLVQPDEGEIRVFEKPVTPYSNDIKEHIGVVLEEATYPDTMKINEMSMFYPIYIKHGTKTPLNITVTNLLSH